MPNAQPSLSAGYVHCILTSRMLAHVHGHDHIWADGGDDGGSESAHAAPSALLHHLPRLFPHLYGHNDDGCVDAHVRVCAYAYADGSGQVRGGSVRVWLALVVRLMIGIVIVVLLYAGVGAGAGAGACDNDVSPVELGGLDPREAHGYYG